MRTWLMCMLLLTCCVLQASAARAQGDPASEVIQLVNNLRMARGLPPYQVDPVLMSVAQAQASWSAANNHIGHDGPGGSSPLERALAGGYGGGAQVRVTENAASGSASLNTPSLVVTMWQGDAVHLNALVSPDYQHIGVGFAEAGGTSWYVLMAGRVTGGAGPAAAGSQATPGAAAPYSPFTLSEPDASGAIYHQVQPGQSAWSIAAHYGVDLAELLALNHLSEGSFLQPGDLLIVRPPDLALAAPSPTPLSEVAAGPPLDASPVPTASPRPTMTNAPTAAPEVGPPTGWPAAAALLLIGIGIALLATAAALRGGSRR